MHRLFPASTCATPAKHVKRHAKHKSILGENSKKFSKTKSGNKGPSPYSRMRLQWSGPSKLSFTFFAAMYHLSVLNLATDARSREAQFVRNFFFKAQMLGKTCLLHKSLGHHGRPIAMSKWDADAHVLVAAVEAVALARMHLEPAGMVVMLGLQTTPGRWAQGS